MRAEDQAAFFRFLTELRRESDRGLALIGASFIDERLAATISAFFVSPRSDLLQGKNAPLSSFFCRIELCHALGLIDDIERHDADCIRKIRNEFAHNVSGASFAQQRISSLCMSLKAELPDPDSHEYTQRFRFENAVLATANRLFYRAEYVAREKRERRIWVEPAAVRWRRVDEELPPDIPVIAYAAPPARRD